MKYKKIYSDGCISFYETDDVGQFYNYREFEPGVEDIYFGKDGKINKHICFISSTMCEALIGKTYILYYDNQLNVKGIWTLKLGYHEI